MSTPAVTASSSCRRQGRRPGRGASGALLVGGLGMAALTTSAPAADLVPAPLPPIRGVTESPPRVNAPRLVLKPETGFFDDAWAVEPSGKRLAVVRTNREDFQRVEVYDLEAGSTASFGFDVMPPTRVVESVSFMPNGTGFLLVSAEPASGHKIEAFDGRGKPIAKSGFVLSSDFGISSRVADSSLLVAVDRRPARAGEMTYVVSAYKLPTLQPVGKARTHSIKADGALRSSALIPVAFFDGYSKLLAQRAGWYDKAKDARQPDASAVVDLLSGKIISEAPIEDVYGWARTSQLRREHPNRTAFVTLAGTLGGAAAPASAGASTPAGAGGLELVDPFGRLIRLPLAVPFGVYDRLTLTDQEGPDPGLLHFGIEVDPVNAAAVARKKADAAALDVYTVAVANPTSCSLRARVSKDTQPAVWKVAANRLVVLRRFRSFVRGGDRLDVYDLVP